MITMTHTGTRPLNGVNAQVLTDLFTRAHADGEPLRIELSTHLRWRDGLATEGAGGTLRLDGPQDRSHHAFRTDLPEPLAGSDTGPAPTEMLLAATAACVSAALVELATAEGIRLDRVEAHASTALDARGALGVEGVPVGPGEVTLRFDIDADAAPEQLQALIRAAVAASPTAQALIRPTSIRTEPNR
ncbi:OsmC family protein [Nocardiopsis valliformis]|uniref:OsmC family protein n=1 Tax=Nocardiopsis valliformis TaxID=239974 RepID=UPI000360754F|nr:OsmC family protein [Nocardiopsis valliformis]